MKGNVEILVMLIVLGRGMGIWLAGVIDHQVVGLIQVIISIIITHVQHQHWIVPLYATVYATPKPAKPVPKGIIHPVETT